MTISAALIAITARNGSQSAVAVGQNYAQFGQLSSPEHPPPGSSTGHIRPTANDVPNTHTFVLKKTGTHCSNGCLGNEEPTEDIDVVVSGSGEFRMRPYVGSCKYRPALNPAVSQRRVRSAAVAIMRRIGCCWN